MLMYEELEEFMEMLKTVDHIAPIYVTVARATKESIVYGSVLVMVPDDKGVFHGYEHREDIKSVRMVPDVYFSMIDDAKRREAEYAEYKARFDNFEESLSKEYFKMRDVLKALGFQKIFNAHIIA